MGGFMMKKMLAILFILVILCSPVIESKVMASADELPKLGKMSNSPVDQFNILEE